MLSWKLANAVTESRLSFREEMNLYNSAFHEVTRQVAVHCSERGEVLQRLQSFYTRSTEVTAKLAEKSVRAAYEDQILSLQEQVAALQEQLVEAKSMNGGQIGGDADRIVRGFHQCSLVEQREALNAIMDDAGYLLLTSDEGEPLPAGDQAANLQRSVFSHCEGDSELVGLVAELTNMQDPSDKLMILTTALSAASDDERAQITFQALDYGQRKKLMEAMFSSTIDSSKGQQIADFLQPMQKSQAHAIMAASLEALEAQATTTQKDFAGAWPSYLDGSVAPAIIGAMLETMDRGPATLGIQAGLKQWRPADAIQATSELLLQMSKADCSLAVLALLDKLKPPERRHVLTVHVQELYGFRRSTRLTLQKKNGPP